MSIAVADFLTAALTEIRVARAGDVVDPEAKALALLLFNELLDRLNIEGRALYTDVITSFTLTPNHQPHTIGLTANAPDLVVTIARPAHILDANFILPGTSAIRVKLDVHEEPQWLMDLPYRTLATTVPRDLFYAPDWPNGSIFLFPICTGANSLELHYQALLAQVTDADTLDLPPGYQQALRLTLAETLAAPFGQPIGMDLARRAAVARDLVWGNNDEPLTIATRDAGMPGVARSTFDYRTGFSRP